MLNVKSVFMCVCVFVKTLYASVNRSIHKNVTVKDCGMFVCMLWKRLSGSYYKCPSSIDEENSFGHQLTIHGRSYWEGSPQTIRYVFPRSSSTFVYNYTNMGHLCHRIQREVKLICRMMGTAKVFFTKHVKPLLSPLPVINIFN